MNYGKCIGALLLALLLTGCSRKKEALQVVDRFMLCAKDTVEKCKDFYPAFDSLDVALNDEKYAIDFKLTDQTIERFIKEHHFSGHEYEDFVKKMQE